MREDLATKYDLRVPRYTSYPTAPHFSDAVTGEMYGEWLSALPPSTKLSLYTHIPFCDSMCWFCGCYTKIVKQYKPVMDYLNVVLQEMEVVAKRLPERMSAKHVHFGGGSPTMLSAEDFSRTIGRINDLYDFTDDAEIAVELDPRTATEDYVKALAQAGVNRASIGVQDFDEEVQKAINRIQPFEVTERVVNWLRKHGIEKINMDLLYGLPHQSTERVLSMVDKAATLAPVRVALFGYAHVPWMKSHMKMINEEDLPGTEERWHQYELASARLKGHGYEVIGLDHFALPGDELATALKTDSLHRNFQGYTIDSAPVMLGFGASSIGQLPQGYVQNLLPLRDYRRHVEEGKLPIGKGLAYKGDDLLRSDIIERLMCDLKVDVASIATKHRSDQNFAEEFEKLTPLAEDGIVEVSGKTIKVTEDGRPLVRLVAAAFDTYLASGKARHSKAV